VGFADKMNGMPKYVVSTTLDKAEWSNSTLITGDVVQEVSKLKEQPGGDVLVAGSGRLVHTLMENDLVDEYRLMVFPLLLGAGKRLFENVDRKAALSLVEAKPVGAGVGHLREVARQDRRGSVHRQHSSESGDQDRDRRRESLLGLHTNLAVTHLSEDLF